MASNDVRVFEALEYRLGAVKDVHAFLAEHPCDSPTGWWYRGQADASWELVPKAGRKEYRLIGDKSLGRFRAWSKKAIAYEPQLPENDWERLAVAQHFGLATCLLDWSHNPLVALFFAVNELPGSDGALYLYEPPMYVLETGLKLDYETQCAGFGFLPRAITPRILHQSGVFTVHLPPTSTVSIVARPVKPDTPTLIRLVIPASLKEGLQQVLVNYGVTYASLFPDLGGVSADVNWMTARLARGIGVRRGEPDNSSGVTRE